MIGIIIAGHDDFAKVLADTAQAIMGQQAALETIGVRAKQEDLAVVFQTALEKVKQNNAEILWLVDIFGGTPFHYASRLVVKDAHQHLVTGVNLPMVLQALANREEGAAELAAELERESKTAIRRM